MSERISEPGPGLLWLWVGLSATLLGLGYLLAPVLAPFVVAFLLAYLADPWVDWLERKGLGRTGAVALVFAVLLAAGALGVLIVLPLLTRQLGIFISGIPGFIEQAQAAFPLLADATKTVGLSSSEFGKALRANWQEIGPALVPVVRRLGDSGAALFAFVACLLLIPVVTFYLLRDWDEMIGRIDGLIPRRSVSLVRSLAREVDAVLAEFVRGQLVLMGALALIYSAGLWIVGLHTALAIGVMAGALSFVPYLGMAIGMLASGLAAFLQFHDVAHVFAVGLVFVIAQAIEAMVLAPYLVGERIGLHPVAVIFVVLAGSQLFGFFGALVAVPAGAVMVVFMRHAWDRYRQSAWFTST